LIEDIRWGACSNRRAGFDVARAYCWQITDQALGDQHQSVALNEAAMSIAAGCEDVQIAGGVEHMDHVPMNKDYNPPPGLFRRHSEAIMNMGLTAEYLAVKYGVNRAEQDAFALRSHQLAAKATQGDAFKNEVIPTWGRDNEGRKVQVTVDQCIRFDCSMDGLAKLPPIFNPAGGSVTAGNSSPINVGSAGMLRCRESS
jgi:acetyl-CoA acyltransferase